MQAYTANEKQAEHDAHICRKEQTRTSKAEDNESNSDGKVVTICPRLSVSSMYNLRKLNVYNFYYI